MLRISLEALYIIDAIDRRGSFAKAAQELHRVPSTISYLVGKLEDDLAVQVFERNGPRVVLTPAGRELLREGRYLLRAAIDLEQRVRRVASGWETELAIGMDSMFPVVALAPHLAAFDAVTRQTRLRIVQETLSGPWEALLDRRVDLLVGGDREPGQLEVGVGQRGGGLRDHLLDQPGHAQQPVAELAQLGFVGPVGVQRHQPPLYLLVTRSGCGERPRPTGPGCPGR